MAAQQILYVDEYIHEYVLEVDEEEEKEDGDEQEGDEQEGDEQEDEEEDDLDDMPELVVSMHVLSCILAIINFSW